MNLRYFIFLALIVFSHSHLRVTAEEEGVSQCFSKLASENGKKISEAIAELVSLEDPGLQVLIFGLYQGKVYLDPSRKENNGLFLAGDEDFAKEGESLVKMYEIYPENTPILDRDGSHRSMKYWDLIEIAIGREDRKIIEGLMAFVELTGPDKEKRKEAALNLVQSKGAEALPLLKKALSKEKNIGVTRIIREAICQIGLTSEEPLERFLAAQDLEDINGMNSIAFLKARMAIDDKGQYPENNEHIRERIEQTLTAIRRKGAILNALQTVFICLSLGSILILMALGLSIIYGMMGVINMAHGEFMMIGAYTAYEVQNLFLRHVSPENFDLFFFVSIPLSFLAAGVAGLVIEWLVIRHLYNRPLESLLATWGVSMVLEQSARSLYGDLTAVRLPKMFIGGLEVLPGLQLPNNRLFIMVVTVLVLLGLYLLLNRTRLGTKIRAVTQNRSMSMCLGISSRRIDQTAFFIGAGIAGLAGCVMTLIGNVVPNMGQTYIVDSFLVVVTGGVGHLAGVIYSGLGIGVFTKLLEPIFEAVYGKVLVLAFIIIFLQWRPTGLFPSRGRMEDS